MNLTPGFNFSTNVAAFGSDFRPRNKKKGLGQKRELPALVQGAFCFRFRWGFARICDGFTNSFAGIEKLGGKEDDAVVGAGRHEPEEPNHLKKWENKNFCSCFFVSTFEKRKFLMKRFFKERARNEKNWRSKKCNGGQVKKWEKKLKKEMVTEKSQEMKREKLIDERKEKNERQENDKKWKTRKW